MKAQSPMEKNNLDLYVSPAGNDRWSGRLPMPAADGSDGPVAGLHGARDGIRRLRAAGGWRDQAIDVHIAAGVYELPDTLVFTPGDGAPAACPIRYAAAEGAAPVISGGRMIAGWRETEHGGNRCWIAELPDVSAGRWRFTRLYVNNAPRPRTRLPRQGFYRFTGVAGYAEQGAGWCRGPDRANFAPGEIRAWKNPEDIDLVTYQLWFDTHHRFKAVDEAANTVHFRTMSLGSLRDEREEFARYFVENVFEALDTPGQWYLDRPAGRLYYLPLPGETVSGTSVVAPRLAELLRLRGGDGRRVGNIHFENLAFFHQHWELPEDCPGFIQAASGVPGAVVLQGAEDCVFYGCRIAHVNGYGLEVLAGSTGNVIAACSIDDAGGGGVKIGHEQMERVDPTADKAPIKGEQPVMATTVADCTIRDCGHIFPGAIGIWVGNSGWNRIVHNRIFDCNYTGISCGWTWGYGPTRTVCNLIAHNHIHHINHRGLLSDNGGIYTLGVQPGTVLSGNVIHDIACYGYGAWGIYPDEGSSEMRIEDNLVWGTQKAAFMTHYGRDNLVRNNIFALSRNDHLVLGKHELHRSTVFRRNVCVFAGGSVQGGVKPSHLDTAHYTVEDNLFWTLDGSPLTFGGLLLDFLQAQGHSTGAVVADPLFADAPGGDFALRADSPAKRIGFKPFDWRCAGPRIKTCRPADYAGYAGRYSLPPRDVPVLRVLIELTTPLAEVRSAGTAVFNVAVINVGRAPGQGRLRFRGGPKRHAGCPSPVEIPFALAPGDECRSQVTLKIRRGTGMFWLDAEPAGDIAVPARCLVFDAAAYRWHACVTKDVSAPEAIGAALARARVYPVRFGERVAAVVKFGAAPRGLLFFATFNEPNLRPNPAQPWKGTGLEILTYPPAASGSSQDAQPSHRQVFMVPHIAGRGADIWLPAATGGGYAPVPDGLVSANPIPGGCEIAAFIPWNHLGFASQPEEFPFELIVDVFDTVTGNVVQLAAFDLPCDGWRRLHGVMAINGC